jgi:hypothetical protein
MSPRPRSSKKRMKSWKLNNSRLLTRVASMYCQTNQNWIRNEQTFGWYSRGNIQGVSFGARFFPQAWTWSDGQHFQAWVGVTHGVSDRQQAFNFRVPHLCCILDTNYGKHCQVLSKGSLYLLWRDSGMTRISKGGLTMDSLNSLIIGSYTLLSYSYSQRHTHT